MLRNNQKGQNLIELVVVMGVAIIVVGALTFTTISSLRNAQFSQNQSQATKLAQEGLEKVRSLRNRDMANQVLYTVSGDFTTSKFSDMYSVPCNPCYLKFDGSLLKTTTDNVFETDVNNSLPKGFERQIQIKDIGSGTAEKEVSAVVRWTDVSGTHESRQTTILRKL